MERHLAVALAALVVGAGLAAAVPASAAGPDSATDREAPELPEQWRHTYGGSGDDIFADLVRTDDGGYLLVGWNAGENRDGWVVKADASGQKQWSKHLGGAGTDRFWGVVRTEDGYLLAGRNDTASGPAGWVVELGSDGEVRSQRTVGTGAFYAAAADTDGSGYLFAGWTRDGGTAGWALKLTADGATEWESTYAAPDGYHSGYLRAIVPTDDGYYLAGKIEGDSDDGWALSVGPDGERRWQATAGGASRDDVWAAAPADSGFVMVGETESDSTGPRDGWLVKFGADGSVEWERRPGGEGVQWLDSAMRTDGGYLFTGSSTTGPVGGADGYVLATDDAGRERWTTHYGTESWDKPWPAIRAHGGGYVLAGQTAGGGGEGKDGWLLRIGTNETGPNTTTTSTRAAETDTSTGADTSTTTDTRTETGTRTGTETDATDTSTAPNDATGDSTDTAETTGQPMRDETTGDTATPGGDVPGFGVGATVAALVALGLLLVNRRDDR